MFLSDLPDKNFLQTITEVKEKAVNILALKLFPLKMITGQHISLRGLSPIKSLSFFNEYFINLERLQILSEKQKFSTFKTVFVLFGLKSLHDIYLFVFPSKSTDIERQLWFGDYESMIGMPRPIEASSP